MLHQASHEPRTVYEAMLHAPLHALLHMACGLADPGLDQETGSAVTKRAASLLCLLLQCAWAFLCKAQDSCLSRGLMAHLGSTHI